MTLIVTDVDELRRLTKETAEIGSFSFDVETIGTDSETGADVRLDPRRNQVIWLGIASRGLSYVIPMGHPVGKQIGTKTEPRVGQDGKTRNFKVPDWSAPPKQLRPSRAFEVLEDLFFDENIEKTGCNIKFDLESCQKYYDNEVIPGPYVDVQVAAHMLNENRHDYRLGSLVKREFDFAYDKKLGERIERYSFWDAARYNHADCKWTEMLKHKYLPEIHRQGLDGLWRLEMDVLGVLLYMERTGALLDVAAAEKLYAELGRQIAQLRGTLFRLAGREINLNSPAQLRDLLFGLKRDGGFGLKAKVLTKGGKTGENKQASTAAAAIELYADHPFVETYLKLQEVDKIHSTYLKAYLGGETVKESNGRKTVEVKPSILINGRVHASFKQHGTTTGRFSCSTPNLQNIPRPDDELGKQVRGLFIAPPGNKLIVADYGQIEYIVMAHFSRDPMLVRAFRDGIDLHQYVAAMVFGKDIEDVTKLERGTAKNTNFAVAYGAGDEKVASMSKISLEEAVRFRKAHRKMLPKLYRWTEQIVVEARRRKPPHVTTLMGRKRRLPTLMSTSWGLRGAAERQAVNTVVQGSAADIIKLAMIRLHAMCDDEMQLSLSVHDELVLICPDDRLDEGQEAMEEAMLGEGIQRLLSVDMKIDMHVADRWSEAKA